MTTVNSIIEVYLSKIFENAPKQGSRLATINYVLVSIAYMRDVMATEMRHANRPAAAKKWLAAAEYLHQILVFQLKEGTC